MEDLFRKYILELVFIFVLFLSLGDYFKWIKPLVPDEELSPSELLFRKKNRWSIRIGTVFMVIILIYKYTR